MEGYVRIPTRVANQDLNAAADINQGQANLDAIIGELDPRGTLNGCVDYIVDHESRIGSIETYDRGYKDIKVKPNAATPNSKVDISWATLRIADLETSNKSFTVDITASGALGLDAGAEAISTWYYLWAIANDDGTVSAILSASSTSPIMPSGYTKKRLVSYVRNGSAGNFVRFVQLNTDYFYTDGGTEVGPGTFMGIFYAINVSLSAASWTEFDLFALVPDIVDHILIQNRSDATSNYVSVKTQGWVNGEYCTQEVDLTPLTYQWLSIRMITTNKKVRHCQHAAQTAAYLAVRGFEVPL